MASRGRRQQGYRRDRRRGPPRQDYQEPEDISSDTLDLDEKKIVIELKSNEQGEFMKIVERQKDGDGMATRGRIIFSVDKAFEFRSILNEFVAEYEHLQPQEETTESERLKTETMVQGRRRYYVDLRQNQRGRFLKLTMLAGGKTFVAIPGEALGDFRDRLAKVLEASKTGSEGGGGGGSSSGGARPPPQRSREPRSSPQPAERAEPILPSKEVRAGGKRFYFDVDQNDRGVFIRLTEVLTSGRRMKINIPQNCWSKMSDAFASYAKDMPYASAEEDSTGSGSEDN